MEARKRMLPPVFWAIICLRGGEEEGSACRSGVEGFGKGE